MSTKRGSSAGPANRSGPVPGAARAAVPLVAVIGGCGGAGASTLAVSLAVTALGNGRRAVLFDADPLGGGLDQLVALATCAAARDHGSGSARSWPHDAETRPRRPRRGDRAEPDLALVSWSCPDAPRIPVAGMRDALRTLRGSADLVVVDLPRNLDDSAQLVLAEATHTLVVTPVSERAAVAAARLLPRLAVVGPRAEILARLPSRDNLTAQELAEILGSPLAGVVRPGRARGALPAAGALGGRSAASLSRFSQRFLDRCAFTRLAPSAGGCKQVAP